LARTGVSEREGRALLGYHDRNNLSRGYPSQCPPAMISTGAADRRAIEGPESPKQLSAEAAGLLNGIGQEV
jgi:hypothetical protein